MNKSSVFAAFIAVFIAFCIAIPVQAESRLYVSGELGMNFGESLDTEGRDTDRDSVCDEVINPAYAMIQKCTDARTGNSWKNNFGSDEGVLFGTALGYRISDSRLRVELEYFYRDTGYDETSDIVLPLDAATAAKLKGEIETAEERTGSLTSHNLFANLYMDFANNSRFTPYVGFGVGLGFTDLDYGLLAQRGSDTTKFITVDDMITGADDIKNRLANTATIEDEKLDDTLFGYQVLFGVDYVLTESLLLGVKGRWVSFDSFKDGDDYDQLRNHASNLRLDGSEPVTYKIKVDDIEMFGVSVNLKYQF